MSTNLHVIHPYSYQADLQEQSIIIGAVGAENSTRNKKVNDFIKQALAGEEVKVIYHQLHRPNTISGLMHQVALTSGGFDFLDDGKLEIITTTQAGVPLPKEAISGVDKEEWARMTEYYTTIEELKEIVGNPTESYFIGGFLEACVANMARLYHACIKRKEEQLFYIPEICASFDDQLVTKAKASLAELGIKELSLAQAKERLFGN